MCPIHVHPVLRKREIAMEQFGMIAPLNSDGYNELKNAQQQGQAPLNNFFGWTYIYNNQKFTADGSTI